MYDWPVPTVLDTDGFRFFFFSNEGNEPAHIHIERGDGHAKFWLAPLELANSSGMKAQELAKAHRLAKENLKLLVERWHARPRP